MKTDLMLYVGRFSEADLMARKDRAAINAKRELAPAFKYIYSKEVRKGRKIVALDVWLSSVYV